MTKNGDEIRVMMMAEDRVARAIELLERIAAHDHQGAAIRTLFALPSGTTEQERMAAYTDCLREVAKTDTKNWAHEAIRELRGEDQ